MFEFLADRGIVFDFYVNEYSVPIYSNLSMINKLKIDSAINGVRYVRLDELKSISLADLKGKSLREISREYI